LKRGSLDGKAYVIANKIEMELVSVREAIEGARIEERRGNTRTDVGTATGDAVVTGNTTTDVVLTLDAPRSVAGRILTDGASRPPVFAQMIVRLTGIRSGAIYDVKAGQDGTFTVTGIPPGQYRVDLDGEIAPWNLSTALSGGVEVLDFPLEVQSGKDVRDLIFTLRDKNTELAGAVVDPATKPVTDRTVILFPSDERFWPAGERRVRACRLTEDGKYQFGDLPPGAYLLAVTESVEPDEWLDPDFLKKLLPASVPLTLAFGEKKVQDLRTR
jgi:hypothetical protein